VTLERPEGSLPATTTARIFQGRAGSSYRTRAMLNLRADHAAARDAVGASLDLSTGPLAALAEEWRLLELASRARTREEHLRRPDLGRRLAADSRLRLREAGDHRSDVQIVVGDGLSAAAVDSQVPALLPALTEAGRQRGWRLGRPLVVRQCRVGVMNDIGEILDPRVVVLLIGERPGLGTAVALSAYLGYRPRPGDTDAQRNLIASIHPDGLGTQEACDRIVALVTVILAASASGTAISGPPPALEAPA
jgi:ethanolamine ammonia-lyase small subunit